MINKKHYICVLCALLLSLFFVFSSSVKVTATESNADITVSVESTLTYDNGNAQADRSKYINLNIKISRKVASDTTLKVSYHTEDLSAVAFDDSGSGDYKAQKSSVTFSGDSTSKTVSIKVSAAPYATVLDGIETGRTFRFVIDSVSEGKIDEDKGCITCQTPSDIQYNISKKSGMSYYAFDEYIGLIGNWEVNTPRLDGGDYFCSGDESIDVDPDEKVTYGNLSLLSDQENYDYTRRYIDTGFASAYITMGFDDINESSLNARNIPINLYAADGSHIFWVDHDGFLGGEDNDDDYLCPMLQQDLICMCVYDKDPDDVYDEFTRFDADDWDFYDSAYTLTQPYGYSENFIFFKLPYGEIDGYCTIQNLSSVSDRWINGLNMYAALIDSTAPVIEDYFVDDSAFISDGKMRVAVRFSEPVQIQSGVSPTVKAKLQRGTTSKDVVFNYLTGDRTDTLSFEADFDSLNVPAGLYTNITLTGLTGAAGIGDFAYIGSGTNTGINNKFSNKNAIDIQVKLTGISVDYRTPEIGSKNITCSVGASAVANQRDFEIEIGNMTEGVLYYELTGSAEAPGTYSSCVSLPEDGVQNKSGNYVVSLSYSGLTGEKYLHVKAVSAKGMGTADEKSCEYTYGVYLGGTLTRGCYFDSTAPVAGDVTTVKNALSEKTYSFKITKDAGADKAAIDSVYVSVACEDEDGNLSEENAVSYCIWKSASSDKTKVTLAGSSVYSTDSGENVHSGTYTVTLTATDSLFGLTGSTSQGKYLIAFYCMDSAGNISEVTDYRTIKFNVLPTFSDCSFSANETAAEAAGNDVYMMSSGLTFSFTRTSSEDVFALYSLSRGSDTIYEYAEGDADDKWKTAVADYFTVTATSTVVTLKPLMPGSYEAVMSVISGSTVTTSDEEYSFVVAGDKDSSTGLYNDETENYVSTQSGLVLNNKVFLITDSFVYMNSSLGVLTENYGSTYGGAFSSQSAAKNYIKFTEYKDLYLVKLSSSLAADISSGANYCEKADNETVSAQEGQYWIRYKRSSWTVDSTASDWVYYFYDYSNPTGQINASKLSDNLKNAMESVSSYLAGRGSYINLVGEDYTDSVTGEPALKAGQAHITAEVLSQTATGVKFFTAMSYPGDTSICSSTVTVTDYNGSSVTAPLASNLRLSTGSYSKLYVKKDEAGAGYIKLNAKNGQLLKEAIAAATGESGKSALYTVLEINGWGVREYYVYVDNTAPSFNIDMISAGVTQERTLTSDNNGATYSYSSFELKGFNNETDEFAYVATYTSSGKVLNVYYAEDLEYGITLSDGNYNIEIGDRSGNCYYVSLKVSSDELKCSVTEESDGNGVIVRCTNRDESQIYRYEVKCNGVLLSNVFAESRMYRDSGNYTVYIRDIYGNTFEKEINFVKAFPSVTIRYAATLSGDYNVYSAGCGYAVINETKSGSGEYNVITSAYLSFTLDADCVYEVSGITENTDYTVTTAISGKNTVIKLLTRKSFTLKVSTEGYEDIQSVYHVSTEVSGPVITASCKTETYENTDTSLCYDKDTKALKSGYSEGDSIIPSGLTYSVVTHNDQTVNSGDSVNSNLITAVISDESGIKSYKLTKDGVTVTKPEVSVNGGVITMIMRAAGLYEITATDIYNNTSVFTVYNYAPDGGSYFVDGNEKANYSGENTYGHSDVTVLVKESGKALFRIVKGSNVYFYMFEVVKSAGGLNNTNVYLTGYTVLNEGTEENKQLYISEIEAGDSNIIFNSADKGIKEGKYYGNLITTPEGVSIEIMTSGGDISLRVSGCDCTVESRLTVDNAEPYYNYTVLSSEVSEITLRSLGETVNNEKGKISLVKDTLVIESPISSDIISVKAGYSEEENVSSLTEILNGGVIDSALFDFSREGFYRIEVTNIYGNINVYLISMSKTYAVGAYVEYSNSALDTLETKLNETVYGNSYMQNLSALNGTVYSNKSVLVQAYGENMTATVNGDSAVLTRNESGAYELTLTSGGIYAVKLTDAYGVVKQFNVVINTGAFSVDNTVISGCSGLADIYSKDKLSLDKDVITSGSVKYISYIYNGKETVLYDGITESSEAADLSALNLTDVIGADGDGVYNLILRNNYGEPCTITVDYKGTPALTITRYTSLAAGGENVSCSETEIWANQQVVFTSTAKNAGIILDGNSAALPLTVKLDSVSGDAKLDRTVTYSDEYGYSYSLTVHLLRQSLSCSEASGVNVTVIDGVYTTRDKVSVVYTKDSSCVYYLDGVLMGAYDGSQLQTDGVYRFVVTDKAGNSVSYTIERDTTCSYSFSESDRSILSGGVATTSVKFTNVDDTCYMDEILLDGSSVSHEGSVFTDAGKWEIMVKDQAGNASYFSFYIISHELGSFDYTCPYNYYIDQLLYDRTLDKDTSNRQDLVTVSHQKSFSATEDGYYTVVMVSELNGAIESFSFVIDTTPPTCTLVGAEEGGITTETVTLKGCKTGDSFRIYKNGELTESYTLDSETSVPEITTGGKYVIEVTNQAGITKTFTFEKKVIANTAGSIFIIIVIIMLTLSLFTGLLLRKKTKVDR